MTEYIVTTLVFLFVVVNQWLWFTLVTNKLTGCLKSNGTDQVADDVES